MSKPVSSMTGYACTDCATVLGPVTVEIRSVNSRFLDLTLRICDELRPYENQVRAAISARIARGKCECRISLKSQPEEAESHVSRKAAEQLAALQQQVLAVMPQARPMDVADILAFPGIVQTEAPDLAPLEGQLLEGLNRALGAHEETRRREGAALAAVILRANARIADIAEQVRARMPELLALVQARLTERLEEALGKTLSEAGSMPREEISERIRQEVTLYGMKMDVAEELDRLRTHTAEVVRVLEAGGPVGRRLDFLMQELNRESNTLGSKASAIEMTNASVELKLLIEQMREQIQNLE